MSFPGLQHHMGKVEIPWKHALTKQQLQTLRKRCSVKWFEEASSALLTCAPLRAGCLVRPPWPRHAPSYPPATSSLRRFGPRSAALRHAHVRPAKTRTISSTARPPCATAARTRTAADLPSRSTAIQIRGNDSPRQLQSK
jgi:hypothetical protein